MARVISPESAEFQELQKFEQWDKHGIDGTVYPAGNPYVYRPYPKMLYRAQPNPRYGGKVMVSEPPPDRWSFPAGPQGDQMLMNAELASAQFTASCQRKVGSEREHQQAERDGWCESPTAALAYHEKLQQDIAQAAAEARFAEQRMSEKARAEVAQAEAESGAKQVVDVTSGPKRGPYRRRAVGVTATGPQE